MVKWSVLVRPPSLISVMNGIRRILSVPGRELRTMTLTVLDPRTGKLVTIVVAEKGHERRSLQVAGARYGMPFRCARGAYTCSEEQGSTSCSGRTLSGW